MVILLFLYSTVQKSAVQYSIRPNLEFIYKIIAVIIYIYTSCEWIAMYGPVQYSTVQYSTVQYITTVIIDTSGHCHGHGRLFIKCIKRVTFRVYLGKILNKYTHQATMLKVIHTLFYLYEKKYISRIMHYIIHVIFKLCHRLVFLVSIIFTQHLFICTKTLRKQGIYSFVFDYLYVVYENNKSRAQLKNY